MTEQTTELSEDAKAALADEENRARQWVRIQNEEAEKKAGEEEVKRIPGMTNREYRDHVMKKYGYDAGV